ncbi:uncharacterized protein LOC119338913 isoform X1 [Triticum dicoccoides]|uniref:uncharacterized protein LOC119338913 isoform X1 n=1 Tax=Triticum dicoccoides TaxID=85692 RepID=UPI0018918F90|nr:uncharacterized protein LOC119338913 isoform X1 [Triticum dicoccoides]
MSESGAGCLHVGVSACGAGRLLEPGVSCCRFKAGHILEPCTSFCGLKVVPRCGLQPVGGMASRSANILVASAALRPPASEPPTRVFIFCPWAESIRQVHRMPSDWPSRSELHQPPEDATTASTSDASPAATVQRLPSSSAACLHPAGPITRSHPVDGEPRHRERHVPAPGRHDDDDDNECGAVSLLRAEGQGTERTTARLTRRPETLLPLPPWILADAHLRHRRAPPLETSRDQDYQLCHGLASAIAAHHRSGHYRDRDYQLCHGLALWNHRRSRCQDPAVLLAG